MPDPETTETLPYRTTRVKFDSAIQALRQSPGSLDALDLAVGQFDRAFVVRNLVALGLVTQAQSPELTEAGRAVAYSEGQERCMAVLRALIGFPPYKVALMEAAARKQLESITTKDIASIWGQKKIGSDDDARLTGAIMLAGLMESAGLGTFSVGRRGSPSRVDLSPGWRERLVAAFSNARAPILEKDIASIPPRSSEGLGSDKEVPKTGFVRHHFQLRRGMVIEVELPDDLTAKEVDRFSKWLATLPLEEMEG